MIQVGENSGSLDECLQSVAEYAEEEMQRRIGFLAKMIEPALFVIIGTLVGFVYMAFYTSVLSAATSVLR